MPTKLLYAQSLAQTQSTSSGNWEDMAGLVLTLPQRSNDEHFALVTLNVPNPYAKGGNYPGCNFALRVTPGNTLNWPYACFTSYNKVADPATAISAGRVPTTLVVRVPLDFNQPTTLQAVWQSVRGATAVVDSPCSLSAVVGRN